MSPLGNFQDLNSDPVLTLNPSTVTILENVNIGTSVVDADATDGDAPVSDSLCLFASHTHMHARERRHMHAHTHTHIHTHACRGKKIHTHTHTLTHTRRGKKIHTYTHVCREKKVHAHTHARREKKVHAHTHMHAGERRCMLTYACTLLTSQHVMEFFWVLRIAINLKRLGPVAALNVLVVFPIMVS